MKVNLTSNFTTFYSKIFWPIFLCAGMVSALIFPLPENDANENIKILILGSLFIFFILFNAFRFKFVSGDNDFLYVRNVFRKTVIPLTNLSKVTESRFPMRIIIVELKEETIFGKKITFIPYSKWFLFGLEHPVLKELQSYIDANN